MASKLLINLQDYLTEKGLTVIDRQPASWVPPMYRNRPVDQQVQSGIKGVEEVLLSNETSVYQDTNPKCDLMFGTAAAANVHKRVHMPKKVVVDPGNPDGVAEVEESKVPPGDKKVSVKAEARRQTKQKPNTEEPTYAELKVARDKMLEQLAATIKDRDRLAKENKGYELATAALRGALEDLKAQPVDHSMCYEFVGKGFGNQGVEIDVIRKDGYVYRAYPV
jgi:hypothetical protein